MLTNYIEKVRSGKDLSSNEAEEALSVIMEGRADDNQIETLLLLLIEKGEQVSELLGFAKAMRKHSLKVHLDMNGILDTCGTGGDGGNTFNISTAVAFIAAAAGIPVAKHGNRAISGKSGSIDVLEALGIAIELDSFQRNEIFKLTNLVFLFAQHHHPAMRYVAPIRKKLNKRTIFNMLGPLTNPAGASYQIIGVYNESLTDKLGETLRLLGCYQAMIVHSHSGLDELSVDGPNTIVEIRNGELKKYIVSPEDVGLNRSHLASISGGTPTENANIIVDIFKGVNTGADRDILLFNAGAALYIANKSKSIKEGVETARRLLETKLVYNKYEQYKNLSNSIVVPKGVST